jgi:hypothetical protein
VSTVADLDWGVDIGSEVLDVVGGGGGSMAGAAIEGFDTGSGSNGIRSSEEVSMVICFVTGGAIRTV